MDDDETRAISPSNNLFQQRLEQQVLKEEKKKFEMIKLCPMKMVVKWPLVMQPIWCLPPEQGV